MRVHRWNRWAVAGALLCACGCSKLTYDRWQTIQVGSASPDAVQATLGDPWKKTGETWVYNSRDRGITAMVKFKGQTVVGKEWADGDRGLETVGEQPDSPGESEQLHIQQIK